MAGFGGTQRLARRIGAARAMELLVTGDLIGADEALRVGLVNKVCAPEALLAEARACGDKIAQKGPLAVAATKRAVRRGEDLPLRAANELERELFAHLFSSTDQKEGMAAFLEKRAAKFTGK
jgi:enoyl-CoA hydratase